MAAAYKKRMDTQKEIRHKLGRGRCSKETFRIGDEVRVQCPKTHKWGITGKITGLRTHEGVRYLSHTSSRPMKVRNI